MKQSPKRNHALLSDSIISNIFSNSRIQKTIIAGIAIVFVFSFLDITHYITKERKRQIDLTEKRLIETTEHNAAMIRMIFDNYVDTLRSFSVFINHVDDFKPETALMLLKNMAEAFNFKRLSISFPDAKVYTTDGVVYNMASDIAYNENHESLESGQFLITNVTNSIIDEIPIVSIYVPVSKNGKVIAALGYSIAIEDLNKVIKTFLLHDDELFSLIDENGRYVFISNEGIFSANSNFFENLDLLVYSKRFSKEMIEKSFRNITPGHVEYALNGIIRYGYYTPIGINNWFLLMVRTKDIIDADTNKFVASSLMLSAQIALIILVISSLVYYQQNRMRVITELNERCFHILAEHTGKVILEWNYREKLMHYSNFEKVVGWQLSQNKLRTPDDLINAGMIYQDDYDIFKKMFSDISNGQTIENVRIRLCSVDQNFEYYSVFSIVISDTKGKPYKSIGFLENIDSQVRREENLLQKANIDQLTGLYNKSAAEQFISEILSSDKNANHALFCIDLDNFKNINDTFGHLYGDKVLKELSGGIKELFRKSDILGRFGGDEFVIFVPNMPNIEFIEAKAVELNKCLHRTYRDGNTELTVSASIGIAVYPKNGDTYKTDFFFGYILQFRVLSIKFEKKVEKSKNILVTFAYLATGY